VRLWIQPFSPFFILTTPVFDGLYHDVLKLKISQVGDPVLRQAARPLTNEEIRSEKTQALIELMRETMRDAPGVGLAAPQVGVSVQLAVIEDQPAYIEKVGSKQAEERQRQPVPFHVIINPRISPVGEETAEFFEGCLSLAGFVGVVRRSLAVRVEALNERAEPVVIEARGWYARILQHEIDHLQGTLYLDRMRTRSFTSVENYDRFWKETPPSSAGETLP
jgi:peptide deformylase